MATVAKIIMPEWKVLVGDPRVFEDGKVYRRVSHNASDGGTTYRTVCWHPVAASVAPIDAKLKETV